MKPEAYRHTILRVDLARKKYEIEEIGLPGILKFIGGRGLGAKILFAEQKPGIGSRFSSRSAADEIQQKEVPGERKGILAAVFEEDSAHISLRRKKYGK